MKIQVYIPTMKRINKQIFWDSLPQEARDNTVLVCPPDEVTAHAQKGRNVLACDRKGITATRDFIVEHAIGSKYDKIVMFDDDCRLQTRRPNLKIDNSSDSEMMDTFHWLEDTLRAVAHCGVSVRTVYYKKTDLYLTNVRLMYCLAYDVETLLKTGARFGKGLDPATGVMEDFNMTLQLLKAGYPNRLSLFHRLSAGQSNTEGGCSTYRTKEIQTAGAFRLKELHPEDVSLRLKKVWKTTSVEGEPREKLYDVSVQWKDAFRRSQKEV